jgi:response regulator of citrate/malate metabolism
MIKTIIIDDEVALRNMNQALLERNFNDIEVVATCGSVDEGTKLISLLQPQLVLLDIQ